MYKAKASEYEKVNTAKQEEYLYELYMKMDRRNFFIVYVERRKSQFQIETYLQALNSVACLRLHICLSDRTELEMTNIELKASLSTASSQLHHRKRSRLATIQWAGAFNES